MKGTPQLIVVLLLSLLALDGQAAGRVLYVKGEVSVERAGQKVPLAKSARIEPGDVLVTGEGGRVQLIMDDGDRMALRPGTRLRIDEFQAAKVAGEPGGGRAYYSLIRGGFRALTRSLGRRDESSYRVKTPVATIGIRGTHYSLRLCVSDCAAKDGLYAGVYGGEIWLSNAVGMLDLGMHEYAHVAGADQAPQKLREPPPPLRDDSGGGQGGDEMGEPFGSRTSPAEGEMDPPGGDIYIPGQPIQGTDPSGSPFDLTPGQVPGRRDIPPPVDTGGQ